MVRGLDRNAIEGVGNNAVVMQIGLGNAINNYATGELNHKNQR